MTVAAVYAYRAQQAACARRSNDRGQISGTNILLIGQDTMFGAPGQVQDFDTPPALARPRRHGHHHTHLNAGYPFLIGQDQMFGAPGMVPTHQTPARPPLRAHGGQRTHLNAGYPFLNGQDVLYYAQSLAATVSGNEITDAVRAAGLQGDPTTPPGSTWIGPAVTNKVTQPQPGATPTTGVTKAGDAAAVLSTPVDSTAPFQAGNAKVWLLDNSAGVAAATVEFAGTASAAAHTGSIWAYAVAGTPTLGIAAAGAVNITGSAYGHFAMTVTALAGDALRVTAPAGAVVRFTAAMLETGSVANPFTPTSRGAARVQVPVAGLFTPTQGWMAFRGRMGVASTTDSGANHYFASLSDNSTNNRIEFFLQHPTTTMSARKAAAGVAGTSPSINGLSHAVGDYITAILAWDSGRTRISANGSAWTEVANVNIPTGLNALLDIGSSTVTGPQSAWFSGDCGWFACGSGILTDADAATIHAFGNTDPSPPQFTLASGLTAIWPAQTAAFLGMPGPMPTYDTPRALPAPRPPVTNRTHLNAGYPFLIGSDSMMGAPGQVPDYDTPKALPTLRPNGAQRTWQRDDGTYWIGSDSFFAAPGQSPTVDTPNARPPLKPPARTHLRTDGTFWIGSDQMYGDPGMVPSFDTPKAFPRQPAHGGQRTFLYSGWPMVQQGQETIYAGPGQVPQHQTPRAHSPRPGPVTNRSHTWATVGFIGMDTIYGAQGMVPVYQTPRAHPVPARPTRHANLTWIEGPLPFGMLLTRVPQGNRVPPPGSSVWQRVPPAGNSQWMPVPPAGSSRAEQRPPAGGTL